VGRHAHENCQGCQFGSRRDPASTLNPIRARKSEASWSEEEQLDVGRWDQVDFWFFYNCHRAQVAAGISPLTAMATPWFPYAPRRMRSTPLNKSMILWTILVR
jgi:hypothetical protein